MTTAEYTTIGAIIMAIIGLFKGKDFLDFLKGIFKSKDSELIEHLKNELKEEKDRVRVLEKRLEKHITKSKGGNSK